MRYVLLFLLLAIVGLSSDAGSTEHSAGVKLQPIIFAAAFGSH